MSDRGLDYDHRRDRRRRYSSDSEDVRRRKDRVERRRSFDRSDKNSGRVRDNSRSDYRRRRHRSRSPRPDRDRARVKRETTSRSRSPPIRRRPRDERRGSRRDYSASRSPPPKRRRHDSRNDDRRHSNYHAEERRRNSSPHRRRYSPSPSPPPPSKRSNAPLPSQNAAFKTIDPKTTSTKPFSSEKGKATTTTTTTTEEKQKPNYAPTGKLAAETNTVANTSIVLKYNEPPDARLPPQSPSSAWRLYVFKGPDLLDTIKLHERSCWLFGRERSVVDYAAEHPSVSKQHAVLQFRFTEKKEEGGNGEDEWGVVEEVRKRGGGAVGGVRPYVIDLESANGTWVNGERVPESRFMEVRSGDVVTFGESAREYVLMLPPKD